MRLKRYCEPTGALCLYLTIATSVSAWGTVNKRAAAAETIKPYSVPPSQYWDGDDGPWSTFSFQVGDPFQQVRLIPSTSGHTFAPISQTGCNANDDSKCPNDRGGLFNPNGSSTWVPLGTYTYTIDYSQPALLGSLANAVDGLDSVQLSWPGSDAPILSQQLVTSIAEKGIFYIGNIGISPRVSNISTQSNQYESPVGALVKAKSIPSQSYGYTAGFFNSEPPAFGSLTLGGYDTTRFQPSPNNVSFPFGPDISRDLLIGIQRISSDASSSSLLPDPIFAFIDSTVSTIWLPTEACRAFERAFGLSYSEDGNFYPLTTSQHSRLVSLNPSVTFTLGATLAGGSTVSITLPYKAFDQTINPPLGTANLKYFPLQRADNSTQYVLGRTFLQHAYLVADYERQSFTLSPALFPQGGAASPQLKAIYPPGEEPSAGSDGGGLTGGTIAGIVVGIVLVLAIIAIVAFFWLRRRKARKASAGNHKTSDDESSSGVPNTEPYTADEKTAELGGDKERRRELEGRTNGVKSELDGKQADRRTGNSELLGSPGTRPELDGGHWRREMDATDDGKKYDSMSREKPGTGRSPSSTGRPLYELP